MLSKQASRLTVDCKTLHGWDHTVLVAPFNLHVIKAPRQASDGVMQLQRCFLVQVKTVVILRSVDCPQQTHHLVQVFVEKYAKHIEHVSHLCFAYQTYMCIMHDIVFVRFYFVHAFQIQTKSLQFVPATVGSVRSSPECQRKRIFFFTHWRRQKGLSEARTRLDLVLNAQQLMGSVSAMKHVVDRRWQPVAVPHYPVQG